MIIIDKALLKCKLIAAVQSFLGCMILPLFLLATLGFIIEPEPDIWDVFIICIIFDALGVWLIYCAVKRVKMMKTLNNYSKFLTPESPGVRIVRLAPLVAESENTIKKNFQWMIKRGFFKDAYIDFESNCVIFQAAYAQAMEKAREEEQVEYVSVLCSCCGGATKIVKGQSGTCEYCGAPLEV